MTATAANSLVKSAYKYVPTLAGAGIIDWLHQALLGGTAQNAAVEWYGPIDRFPYNGRDAKSGLFLVTGNFRNSSLDFLPSDKRTETGARVIGGDWPIVSRVNGQFLFEADRMVIAGDTGISDQVPLRGNPAHGRARSGLKPLYQRTRLRKLAADAALPHAVPGFWMA